MSEPPAAGAVLGGRKLFATGDYWDEAARFVFVAPEKVRVFQPVDLEIPTAEPRKIVMPLTDPGPMLRHSDSLPRADGSPAPKAAVPPGPPEPAPEVAPVEVKVDVVGHHLHLEAAGGVTGACPPAVRPRPEEHVVLVGGVPLEDASIVAVLGVQEGSPQQVPRGDNAHLVADPALPGGKALQL